MGKGWQSFERGLLLIATAHAWLVVSGLWEELGRFLVVLLGRDDGLGLPRNGVEKEKPLKGVVFLKSWVVLMTTKR